MQVPTSQLMSSLFSSVTQRQTRHIPTCFAQPINIISRSLITGHPKRATFYIGHCCQSRKHGGSRKHSIQASTLYLSVNSTPRSTMTIRQPLFVKGLTWDLLASGLGSRKCDGQVFPIIHRLSPQHSFPVDLGRALFTD